MQRSLNLGGHLRSSEGLRYVVVNARALGYSYVQIMLGGDRDFTPFELDMETVNEYRMMSYGMETVVHLPYIINPCEAAPQKRSFYKRTFREFCRSAAAIDARAVVIHPGFKKDMPEPEAYANLLKFFEEAYDEEWKLDVLIETDSGSKNGSAVGSAEFIASAIEDLGNPRFAMCMDTVHLYARGVDLFDKDIRKDWWDDFGHHVRLIHLNCPDPVVTLGSFRDRHNTAFEDRKDIYSDDLIIECLQKAPCILERKSLSVQEKDVKTINLLWNGRNEELTTPVVPGIMEEETKEQTHGEQSDN